MVQASNIYSALIFVAYAAKASSFQPATVKVSRPEFQLSTRRTPLKNAFMASTDDDVSLGSDELSFVNYDVS